MLMCKTQGANSGRSIAGRVGRHRGERGPASASVRILDGRFSRFEMRVSVSGEAAVADGRRGVVVQWRR
jgi:hypothetical protein